MNDPAGVDGSDGRDGMADEIERTTTSEVLNAMAILAEKEEVMPLAGIAFQVAELIHDEEMALPPAAAERLLHIGAALWRKSMALGEKI
jgi:hypothetical protein